MKKKLKSSKLFSKKTQIKESLMSPGYSMFASLSCSEAYMEGGGQQEGPHDKAED